MSWNCRLCQYTVDGVTLFGIREVYYNPDDTIMASCRASVDHWESADDVRGTLTLMREAVNQPILAVDV